MIKRILTSVVLCMSLMAWAQTYTIYPVPQKVTLGSETVAFTSSVNVVCESGIDTPTRDRLSGILAEHGLSASFSESVKDGVANILLGVNGSGETADQAVTTLGLDRSALTKENKYDRHLLHLWGVGDKARLIVLGEHTDAVFFGLASLEQMMDQYTPSAMPTVTINDYADLQSRGLVEGYYGYPYSIEVKKDLMRFMMRCKMNTYLYGAKSDPYHSQKWTEAYPTSITDDQRQKGWLTQDYVRDITRQSAATKVNFIWAIHPGSNFISSSTVVSDILGKFDKMYNLGVRQFAIFVDDVGLPSKDKYQLNADRLTAVQQGLEERYNKVGNAPADTVRPVHFVPQIYATSWVSESEREGFYTALASTPKNVAIYTTGWGVWSIPNSSDINVVRQYLGRDVAWWWNYPCNDNADGQIYTKDMYANFFEMPQVNSNGTVPSTLTGGIGIVSNPMQEGELSKIALFSVADYAWHTAGFRNANSYKAALQAVVGSEDADDFSLLCDYLRWNDPSDFGSLLGSVKKSIANPSNTYSVELRTQLEQLKNLCAKFVAYKQSTRESDRLLYIDIAPWLLKLQTMVNLTLDMLDVAQSTADLTERWPGYVNALEQIADLDANTTYTAYALEGMGNSVSVSKRQAQASHKYFYPFTKWLRENVLKDEFGSTSTRPTLLHDLPADPGSAIQAKYSSSKDTYYLSGSSTVEIPSGCFVGLGLPQAFRVGQCKIDESVRQQFVVRYSEDFRTWQTLTDDHPEPQGFARYFIFQNLGSESKSFRFTQSMFSVTPEPLPVISSVTVPEGANAEDQPLKNLTDGDYSTWWAVKKNQTNGDTYVLNLAEASVIRDVRICFGTKNDDFMNSARVEVSADGATWTALRVKGTSVTTFSLTADYAVKGGDEMKYIDFNGGETTAKYIRLRVVNANTSKWLRLFEMEVNHQSRTLPNCMDASGELVANAVDALPHTQIVPDTKELIYRLVRPNPTTELTFYCGKTIPAGVKIEVTEDGQTWTSVTTLTQSAQRVDLTPYPQAIRVRLSWTGSAPTIHEITEANDLTTILPTAIGSIPTDEGKASAAHKPLYDLQGRRVVKPYTRGLYIRDGRKVVY